MPLITDPKETHQFFDFLVDNKMAVPAVCAGDDEALFYLVRAAEKLQSPLIIQPVPTQVREFGGGVKTLDDGGNPLPVYDICKDGNNHLGIAKFYNELTVHAANTTVPIIAGLDHVFDATFAIRILQNYDFKYCIDHKFPLVTSLCIDASDSTSLDEAIGKAAYIEQHNNSHIAIEFEPYEVAGGKGTTVADVRKICSAIKTDGLYLRLFAPDVGAIHGQSSDPDFSKISEYAKMLSDAAQEKVGIGLHGGSGVSDDGLKYAVENGLIKVNFFTGFLKTTGAVTRDYCQTHRDKFGERDYCNVVANTRPDQIKAVGDYLQSKMEVLGCLGKGPEALKAIYTR